MKHFLLGILALLVCSCSMTEEQDTTERITVGDKLPVFELTLNDGTHISTTSLLGKKVVLVFFNTSCQDCQRELPEIQKLYEIIKNDNDDDNDDKEDILVIAISRAESEASVADYWQHHSFTIPYSAQQDRRIYELFATSIIPRIYIADKTGKVIATFDDTNAPTAEQLLTIVKGGLI